jgi:hypothetical protein
MREVIVLIVGDYKSQYINVEFDTVEMLNQQIDNIIDELDIGCVSVIIEDDDIFSQKEILFLNENDIEI